MMYKVDQQTSSSPLVPHPSLSRPLSSADDQPQLYHSLYQKRNTILSLAADDHNIYSGSQGDDILVWDKVTFTLKTTLKGHTASVLALEYAADKKWLFSASGDSTIRVWSTETFTPLCALSPYLDTDAGDLFSLAWSPELSTLYFGCQNTSIQWFSFPSSLPSTNTSSVIAQKLGIHPEYPNLGPYESGSQSGTSTPRRAHKFFDSYPQYTHRAADHNARNPSLIPSISSPSTERPTPLSLDDACLSQQTVQDPLAVLQVPPHNVVWSAHYGYVYCMALSPSPREGSDDQPPSKREHIRLITGSGDASVKVWSLTSGTPTLHHTFDCGQGAVLALTVRGDTVYAGCQDGYVKVWDLETRTLVRTLIVIENVDVLSLSMLGSDLYTCSANGQVQRWSASFDLSASWTAHSGIILSSIITFLDFLPDSNPKSKSDRVVLVTGGNDDHIKLWKVDPPKAQPLNLGDMGRIANSEANLSSETLIYALSKFLSIPSVSGCLSHKEDCRQAAIWLRKCLNQLGAESSLLPTGDNTNPLVLATFHGTQSERKSKRILFYGHYDVISAPPKGWSTDPFSLYSLNGYLYGRGITDNKGPIMAVACAAADLLSRRALDLDLVLLIEGEEEAGSAGFAETVRRHKDQIGPIDAILVSNSTWISEDTPCITYGLRGVVHCEVQISSLGPDLHSGVDGGAAREPMTDMIKLLGTLTDDNHRVAIPDFYDEVRPLTEDERQLYKVLSGVTQAPASSLSAKWREPSLTIHEIEVSGPKNSTVIPATVKSHVSLRIVPDQDLDEIVTALQEYLKAEFAKMKSSNTLKLGIRHTADWWLGNLDDPWFNALENAIKDEWGVEPLRIREGGSIPSVPWLEKEFSCHALHLPLGQSTDQAHLPNERMSLSNLQRGKAVIERFMSNVAAGI